MRQSFQLDKNISYVTWWERERTDTDLQFFFLVINHLFTGSRSFTPLHLPKIGLDNLRPPACSWLLFKWHRHFLEFCRRLPKEQLPLAHVQIFQPPVLISHFGPCYFATSVCFVYLFIYLSIHVFNFLWAIQLRYIPSSRQFWNF